MWTGVVCSREKMIAEIQAQLSADDLEKEVSDAMSAANGILDGNP